MVSAPLPLISKYPRSWYFSANGKLRLMVMPPKGFTQPDGSVIWKPGVITNLVLGSPRGFLSVLAFSSSFA